MISSTEQRPRLRSTAPAIDDPRLRRPQTWRGARIVACNAGPNTRPGLSRRNAKAASITGTVDSRGQSLVRVNQVVSASGQDALDDHRVYEYVFAGPAHHGLLGQAAAKGLARRCGPLRGRSEEFAVSTGDR